MDSAPDDIAAVLPTARPWDQRGKSVLPLAGGYTQYLETLRWILETCRDEEPTEAVLQQRYAAEFNLGPRVAQQQLWFIRRCDLLHQHHGRIRVAAPSARYLAAQRPEIIIGTMHANLQFVGELLHEIRGPRTRKSLLETANGRYGLAWKKDSPVAYRLGWLRSAGLAEHLTGHSYQANGAGIAFLERIDLYVPSADSPLRNDVSPPCSAGSDAVGSLKGADMSVTPLDSAGGTTQGETREGSDVDAIEDRDGEAAAPGTKLGRSAHGVAAEIGDRLESLSCDGSKHQEFEVAVRDAFAFLGFGAERLSGPGQTDVLLTGVRPPEAQRPDDSTSWRYLVAVDAKAATNGRLADLQVTWPALALHRKQHSAAFSVLVGPSPRSRLLQFAVDASVTVLSAEQLALLCRNHAEVPLPVADYLWLFVDSEGDPRGGAVDLSPIADARAQATARRDLLAQVGEAVQDIAADFGPANRQLVRFSLAKTAALSGDALGIEVAAALDFLSSRWLRAIARSDPESADPHYMSTAPGRTVAARLRWLADAFDEVVDQARETPETG